MKKTVGTVGSVFSCLAGYVFLARFLILMAGGSETNIYESTRETTAGYRARRNRIVSQKNKQIIMGI